MTRHAIPLQRLALIAALLVTVVVYFPTAFFDFAYDDFGQIVFNPGIKSWDLTLKYFTSQVWAQIGASSFYYRPVFMIWLSANYALFGLHPLYWHLAAIALHLLACLLLYFFLCRLTKDRWISTVAVLLFGLHPAHIEAVAWISGATETLLAILFLGSLLCYQKQLDSVDRDTKANGLRTASLLLASLAVLAKETAIVLPAVIFSYEWIFRRTEAPWRARLWSATRAAVPYAFISFGFLALRTLALHRLTPPRTPSSLFSVILAWPDVMMFYVAHALSPLRLSAFYEPILVTHPGLWNFFLPLFFLLAVAVMLIYGSRRSRVCCFLAMWYAILLVPILGITLSYNVENVHDRYLYLPSVALCVLFAALTKRLTEMRRTRTALIVLVTIGAGFAFLTIWESQYWRNDNLLGQHSLSISPGNPLAAQVVGNAYIRDERISEAIPYLLNSLETLPNNSDTLRSLGLCYLEMNALPLAEESLTKAIRLNTSRPETHLLLGVLRFRQNRLDEAEAEIRRGIELRGKTEGTYHYTLGNVLYARGDVQGAIREYRMELQNDPATDPDVGAAQMRIDQVEKPLRE